MDENRVAVETKRSAENVKKWARAGQLTPRPLIGASYRCGFDVMRDKAFKCTAKSRKARVRRQLCLPRPVARSLPN